MPRAAGVPLAPVRPAITVLVLAFLLAAGGCTREPEPLSESLFVFGGEATLEVRGVPEAQARPALAEIAAAFNTLHRDWHAWEPGALTELNAAFARGERSRPPASLRDLILRSQPLSIRSDGAFEPAIGELMQLWGFHTSEFPVTAPLPTRAQVDAWRARRPSVVDVVVEGDTVYSLNPAVQLDFGGIAEGVAVEVATTILERHRVRDALLSLGGDIYALGSAGRRPWRVAIRDPYGGALAELDLHDREALFSSGNYNKFREAPSGGRWSHILDPRTGQPVLGSSAVSVLHRDPVLADVAATALMVGGPARFADLSARLDVRCALLLTEENEMIVTAAMHARLRMRREPVMLGEPIGADGPCSP
jgi:thiamine biosynthesis lipoprotein